jgi:hypothetical protein
MTLITISQASINYTSGHTDCACSVAVDVPTIGQTFVAQAVSLDSGDLTDDWTDAELCEAVATKLGVPVEDVSVAVRPEPVVVDVPEADFGNPPQGDTPQPLTPEDVSPAVAPV